jgi:hypothetical protein
VPNQSEGLIVLCMLFRVHVLIASYFLILGTGVNAFRRADCLLFSSALNPNPAPKLSLLGVPTRSNSRRAAGVRFPRRFGLLLNLGVTGVLRSPSRFAAVVRFPLVALSTKRWCIPSLLLASLMVKGFGVRSPAPKRARSVDTSDEGGSASAGSGSASTNAYPFTLGVSLPSYPASESGGLGRPAMAASTADREGDGGTALEGSPVGNRVFS